MNSLNSSSNLTFANNTDFFHFLMKNNSAKIICLAISFFCIVIGPTFHFGIIWFEKYGSDTRRTLLNMFTSICCWCCIEFIVFVQIADTLRFVIGPLPVFVCYVQIIARNAIITAVLLFLDAMILTRYIFIFWLKNPAAFNNEFWCFFLNIWIQGASVLLESTWHFKLKYQSVGFYICTGDDPTIAEINRTKIYGLVELFSALLHIVLYTRIYFYKNKGNILINVPSVTLKLNFLKDFENQSFITFATQFFGVFILCASTYNTIQISGVKAKDFEKYPNYLFVYYRSLVATSTAILGVAVIFLVRKDYLRPFVEEVKILNCPNM